MIVAKNEEDTIGNIVDNCKPYGKVFVVNDNSTDSTLTILRKKKINIVTNRKSLGYGCSVLKGIKEIVLKKFTHLVMLDADGEHNPKYIKEFIKKLKDKEVLVLGVRQKIYRFSEKIFVFYYKWKFGVSDMLCGMRGFDLKIIEKRYLKLKDDLGLNWIMYYLKTNLKFCELQVSGKKRFNNPRFGNMIRANFKILSYLSRNLL
ncbi:MAG: glycosyltransferase family 2 protein [Alphaproteobacteria bacterium]